jgi:hypothetical protein
VSAGVDPALLAGALARYDEAIERVAASRLPELDVWYRRELPALLGARAPAFATRDELVRVTEWKMKRGTWRANNLLLVRSNAAAEVERATAEGFAAIEEPRRPVAAIVTLAGVGPATASALLAALRPDRFPFFDEVVARELPELGPVAFTLPYYLRYAERLRAEAARIGEPWTAHAVAQALWAKGTLAG